MRTLFLAFAFLFTLGNSSEEVERLYNEGNYAAAASAAQLLAERGDPDGHAWLGSFYEDGEGVIANPATAALHYRIAAGQGNNYALWRLGVMIDTGEAEGTPEEAVAYFRAAAAQDYTNAMVSMAVMHASGRGTPLDYNAALESYMRAAQLGDSGGVRGVGVMFELGQAVEQDSQEALAWFLLGAAMGSESSEEAFYQVADNLPTFDEAVVEARALAIARELGLETDD